jgi:hypothetical protein
VDAVIHTQNQATYGWDERNGSLWFSSTNASVVFLGTFPTASIRFGVGAVAGKPAELLITIKPKLSIDEMASLSLRLPGFTSKRMAVNLSGAHGNWFRAVWERDCGNEAALLLLVLPGRRIPKEQQLDIVVSSSMGISLPESGVKDDTGVSIGVDGTDAKVSSVLAKVQRIGSFFGMTLDFVPRTVDVPVTLTFSFNGSSMDIAARESIYLNLPGFSGPAGAALPFMDGRYEATWMPAQHQLRLNNVDPIRRRVSTVIVLPASFGLKLPALGVFPSQQITVSTTAVDGPVLSMSIQDFTTVGAFSETSLTYNPTSADNRARITFTFTQIGRAHV